MIFLTAEAQRPQRIFIFCPSGDGDGQKELNSADRIQANSIRYLIEWILSIPGIEDVFCLPPSPGKQNNIKSLCLCGDYFSWFFNRTLKLLSTPFTMFFGGFFFYRFFAHTQIGIVIIRNQRHGQGNQNISQANVSGFDIAQQFG